MMALREDGFATMPEKVELSEQQVELPGMYFNGFQIGLTNADISGIMLLNGQPQLVMNLSFTTAKTLHKALGDVIGSLERVTEREIMTTKEIDRGMATLAREAKAAREAKEKAKQ